MSASCLASSAGVVGLWEGAAASACQLSACQVGISQLHALHVVLLVHKGLAIADLQLVAGASLIDQGGNMLDDIDTQDNVGCACCWVPMSDFSVSK